MTDIALFPIPNCVTFPGSVYPLHVFEPRYRAMVSHCIDNDLPLGVCHTQKEVHAAKPDLPLEEALKTNQATYKPCEVFSAGKCELVETFPDGRMAINVHLNKRYRIIENKQTLPFNIVVCETLEDEKPVENELNELDLLKQKIQKRLEVLFHNSPEAQAHLLSEEWIKKDALAFSFEIFSAIQFDADVLQSFLEMRSPIERLKNLLALINRV